MYLNSIEKGEIISLLEFQFEEEIHEVCLGHEFYYSINKTVLILLRAHIHAEGNRKNLKYNQNFMKIHKSFP